MSKIIKIILIKKKWTLKGVRLFEIGSNPHSNGDIFSRSDIDFFEIKKLINNKIEEIIIMIIVIIIILIIIYIKFI